jgi:RNA polymerase sigma-70 factor (ECF subfamily)
MVVPMAEEVTERALSEGQAAWPGVAVDRRRFAEQLAELVSGLDVSQVQLADLFLAQACLQGDAAALQVITQMLHEEVPAVLRRLRRGPSDADDLTAALSEALLIGRRGGAPLLSRYSGRGKLRGWIKVCAARSALKQKAQLQRQETLDDELLLAGAEPVSEGLEVAYLKARYRGEFSKAFRQAWGQLSVRERNLLRQHHLDGLSMHELAKVYQVHRITVGRWLADARTALMAATKDVLSEGLALPRQEIDSLLRLIKSRLSLSISALLAEEAKASP